MSVDGRFWKREGRAEGDAAVPSKLPAVQRRRDEGDGWLVSRLVGCGFWTGDG